MDEMIDVINEGQDDMLGTTDEGLLDWIRLNSGITIEISDSKYFNKEKTEFMKNMWDIYGDEFRESMRYDR